MRPDVVDKVRKQAAARSPETAEQLDLLLSVDRSTQMLMDKTLNVAWVITEDNLEEIIGEMKAGLIQENARKTKEEITRIKAKAVADQRALQELTDRELGAATVARTTAETEVSRITELVIQMEEDDERTIINLVNEVNVKVARVRSRSKAGVTSVGIILELVSAIMAYAYSSATLAILSVTILILLGSHAGGFLERLYDKLNPKKQQSFSLFAKEAAQRMVDAKLECFKVSWSGYELTVERSR